MPEARGTVILDLDGTLVDSAPDLADALDILLEESGLRPVGLDGTRKLIGHGIAELVKKGFTVQGRPLDAETLAGAVLRFRHIYEARLAHRTRPYPGVPETLRDLRERGWRLVVCTNKLERYARAILDELALGGFFEAVAGPDTFGVAKPDPGHVLRLLSGEFASRPAVMVGDSPADIEAAKAAALPVVAVSYGYCSRPVQELGPDRVVDDFTDVLAAVEALGKRAAALTA